MGKQAKSAASNQRNTAQPDKTPTPPPAEAAAKPTKSAALIALLKRPEGATLEQMMEATGWQKHSVRGFMAGTVRKKHGLSAASTKTESGRVYRIEQSEARS